MQVKRDRSGGEDGGRRRHCRWGGMGRVEAWFTPSRIDRNSTVSGIDSLF